MKLLAIAASAVLAGGVLGSAATAQAGVLVFDVSYTSSTVCVAAHCSTDPTFVPFSRTLTFSVTSHHMTLDTPSYLGPGGYLQTLVGATSIDPSEESPQVLAVDGLAPQASSGGLRWGAINSPLYGFAETDFNINAGIATSTAIPHGFLSQTYAQVIKTPDFIGIPVAPTSPFAGSNDVLDQIAGLGPLEADEYAVAQPFIDFVPQVYDALYYKGTATLDRGASSLVPEPTAWALMVGGFALAGATLRRRGRALTA